MMYRQIWHEMKTTEDALVPEVSVERRLS